jgi:hypothetical protein
LLNKKQVVLGAVGWLDACAGEPNTPANGGTPISVSYLVGASLPCYHS